MEQGMQMDACLQNAAECCRCNALTAQPTPSSGKTKMSEHDLSISPTSDCQADDSRTKVLCNKQYERLSVPMLLMMC